MAGWRFFYIEQIRYTPVDSPSVLPLPQPLTLSHILGKARLRELFKAIGKWSGEECAPFTEVPQAQPAAATKQVNRGGCCLCCVCVYVHWIGPTLVVVNTMAIMTGHGCFVHHDLWYVLQLYHDCCRDSSYHGDGSKRQVGEVNADHIVQEDSNLVQCIGCPCRMKLSNLIDCIRSADGPTVSPLVLTSVQYT